MQNYIKSKSIIYLLFFIFSLILCEVIFYGLKSNEFLYLGDQFLRFNLNDSYTNSFFLRKWENLGVHNGWQFTVQFWDASFFILVYFFGASVQFAERLLFLIVLFLSLSISFFGFKSWLRFFNIVKGQTLISLGITIWYCFNPYVVMLWHGGVYNLGSSITYSVAPLLILTFYESIFIKTNFKSLLFLSLLFFVSFFTFWLFAPLGLFLFIFFLGCFLFHLKRIKIIIFRVFLLISLTTPLILPYLFAITHELFHNANDMNSMYAPTFGNQQGGLTYMFLFLFSWGIYTVWTPRSLYSFHAFYFSQQYLWGIITMYVGVITGIFWNFYRLLTNFIKNAVKIKNEVYLLSLFIFILIVSLFFAKGAQAPLGAIFVFLYEHVPLFTVFRTPDIRFGFNIVLSLALIMVIISKYIHHLISLVFLIIIVILQSSIFFTGIAIKGEEVPSKFYDRVVHIPNTYTEVSTYINSHPSLLSYIYTYPSYEYGTYTLDNEHHTGQDILQRIVQKPFLYLSESSGISKDSFYTLKTIFDDEDYSRLSHLPIEYFIIRNDFVCETCKKLDKNKLLIQFDLVFKNKDFELYHAKKFSPLIYGDSSVRYDSIGPTAYQIEPNAVNSINTLTFSQSYNENWELYYYSNKSLSHYLFLLLPFLPELNGLENLKTHGMSDGYANSWVVTRPTNQDEGFLLVYQPQIIYNFLLCLSFISIIMYLFILTNAFSYLRLLLSYLISYYKSR